MIDNIDDCQYENLQQWSKKIMNWQGCCGGAENGEEGGVDEGEKEHVMGQIDEIGGVTDQRWKSLSGGWEYSWCQTEYGDGSNKSEAEHQGGKSWRVVCQHHCYRKSNRQKIGRPFEPPQFFKQIRSSDTEECAKGEEIDGIGRQSRDESTNAWEIEDGQ